jgi:serine/threonine protein kinase
MGDVYKTRDTRLKRDVALKILPMAVATNRDRLGRFQREAELLAAVNHPCFAQIHGFEQTTDSSALIMELVDGEDLAGRIARGPMPLDEALPVARTTGSRVPFWAR